MEFDLSYFSARLVKRFIGSSTASVTEHGGTYRPPAFSLPTGLRSSAFQPSSPHPSKAESSIFQMKTDCQPYIVEELRS